MTSSKSLPRQIMHFLGLLKQPPQKAHSTSIPKLHSFSSVSSEQCKKAEWCWTPLSDIPVNTHENWTYSEFTLNDTVSAHLVHSDTLSSHSVTH